MAIVPGEVSHQVPEIMFPACGYLVLDNVRSVHVLLVALIQCFSYVEHFVYSFVLYNFSF